MLQEFQKFGRDLFLTGLNNSHSGNLSVRREDKIVITRRGSMLAHLAPGDLVTTALEAEDANTSLASSEIEVHRAVYQNTSALAVVHAHPVHAVALSLTDDEILPVDAEGQYLLSRVPVLPVARAIASEEVALKLPELLKTSKIAVVRGHGSFAAGHTLEGAFQLTTSLENACRIICLTRILNNK